jgi:hypothetical protein
MEIPSEFSYVFRDFGEALGKDSEDLPVSVGGGGVPIAAGTGGEGCPNLLI